jgi:tRNA modification GTPase
MGSSDTICALATPPGEAGLGIIRLSGSDAISVVAKFFQGKQDLLKAKSHRVFYGKLIHPETQETIAEVMCAIMKSPHSYTGENVVEVSAHGNPLLLQRILQIFLSSGCRLAENGEFTKRAFLNGKLDLSQAEAVIQVVRAKTSSALTMAVQHLEGKLGRHLKEIRKKILAILSPIEAGIDFPEEEVPEVSSQGLKEDIIEVIEQIQELLKTAASGKILREGVSAIIAGKPNVGKSSLFNALLRESRAIVTPIPGTTRDSLEEWADIKGIPVKFVDTAGLRNTRSRVEKIGIARSRESLAKGELVLVVLDQSGKLESYDLELLNIAQKKRGIAVLNKSDLSSALDLQKIREAYKGELVSVSALHNQGIQELEEKIADILMEGQIHSDTPMITLMRHQACLERTVHFLTESLGTLEKNYPLDLAAADLRGAAETIGEITGDYYTDDLIEKIFSDFCIGK